MVSAYWLVTKQEVASFIVKDTASQAKFLVTHNTWLEEVISYVTNYIETQSERQFAERSQSYIFISQGEETLNLPERSVASIDAWVDIDGVAVFSDLTALKVEKPTGLIYLSSKLTDGAWYEITYTAGYSTIPDDLKLASLHFIAKLHQMREQKTWISESRTTQEGSIAFDMESVPKSVLRVIEKYKRQTL